MLIIILAATQQEKLVQKSMRDMQVPCTSLLRCVRVISRVFLSVNLKNCGCGCGCQTPEEHDAESEVRSKESRKYVINSLDDLVQVP